MLPIDVFTVVYDYASLTTKRELSFMSRDLASYHRAYLQSTRPVSKRLTNHLYTGYLVPQSILRMYSLNDIDKLMNYLCRHDHIELLILLIENYDCKFAARSIVQHGDIRLFNAFIERGTIDIDPTYSSIEFMAYDAAISGNVEILQQVRALGINIDSLSLVEDAAHFNCKNTLQYLLDLDNTRADNAFICAIINGYIEIAKMALDYGADVNTWNGYALRMSYEFMTEPGSLEPLDCEVYNVYKFLLDNGADMTLRLANGESVIKHPLEQLKTNGVQSAVQLLLDRGAGDLL